MYVRDAKNREEVWLLDQIEAMELDDRAFRSRDYVVAIDERSNEKTGFGRIRIHKASDGSEVCELTSIGVLEGWRGHGIGAHVIERLLEYAGDLGFESVYTLAPVPDYLAQFGFERMSDEGLPERLQERIAEKRNQTEGEIVPMLINVASFSMPTRLRERFKQAGRDDAPPEPETDHAELAEEFGIDPEEATYKYDPTGRKQ